MIELPPIILNNANQNPNLFGDILSDWRLYFGLMINGFFTGLGVYMANKGWEKKIAEILKKLSKL